MSSRGTKVVLSAALQTDVTVKPTTGWEIFPRESDTLNNAVELLDSKTIVDARIKSPGEVIKADSMGDVVCEFIKNTYDKYIAAAACNNWQKDVPTVGTDTLVFGGDVTTMFALAKSHKDILQYHYWAGNQVNTLKLDIAGGAYASLTLGFVGLGYENSLSDYSVSPATVPLSPKATSLNVSDVRIDGVTSRGTACATAFTLELTNNLSRDDCLGDGVHGSKQDAMMMDITGTLELKYGQRAQLILNKQMTAAPIKIEVDIKFPDMVDMYTLTIPKAQIKGDIPAGSAEILKASLAYTVVAETPADYPTLTRKTPIVVITP